MGYSSDLLAKEKAHLFPYSNSLATYGRDISFP